MAWAGTAAGLGVHGPPCPSAVLLPLPDSLCCLPLGSCRPWASRHLPCFPRMPGQLQLSDSLVAGRKFSWKFITVEDSPCSVLFPLPLLPQVTELLQPTLHKYSPQQISCKSLSLCLHLWGPQTNRGTWAEGGLDSRGGSGLEILAPHSCPPP